MSVGENIQMSKNICTNRVSVGENIQIFKNISTNWGSVGEKAASQLAGNSERRYLNTHHRHAGTGEELNSCNYQIHFNSNQIVDLVIGNTEVRSWSARS